MMSQKGNGWGLVYEVWPGCAELSRFHYISKKPIRFEDEEPSVKIQQYKAFEKKAKTKELDKNQSKMTSLLAQKDK